MRVGDVFALALSYLIVVAGVGRGGSVPRGEGGGGDDAEGGWLNRITIGVIASSADLGLRSCWQTGLSSISTKRRRRPFGFQGRSAGEQRAQTCPQRGIVVGAEGGGDHVVGTMASSTSCCCSGTCTAAGGGEALGG